MANLVIVAIPAADDPVWAVSSEKAPHLTILFLGDAVSNPNVAKIVEYVKERARQLEPFNLLVDHRGTLGSDEADVLFFTKEIPWQLIDFRETLKYNQEIQMAYNAIPQRTDWKPHLTLGYPDTPAHPDDWDPMGTQYVSFDKVAVWYGDSEGSEFVLTENPRPTNWSEQDMAMSDAGAQAVNELMHHGVKGMKWGVRKDKPSSSDITLARAKQNSRAAAANKAFAKSVTSRDKATRTQAKKDHQQLNQVFLDHPDRVTALRMTRGEKIVLGLIAVGIPGVGTAAAGGAAGASVASRKLVERAQKKRKAASTS